MMVCSVKKVTSLLSHKREIHSQHMEDEVSFIIITCQVVSVPYQEHAIPFSVNLISFHDVQSFSNSEFVFTFTD